MYFLTSYLIIWTIHLYCISGAYLYRKERINSNKKRFRKWITNNEELSQVNTTLTTNKLRSRGCSEDNFSSSSTLEKREDFPMKDCMY